jgi:hypothetical protein
VTTTIEPTEEQKQAAASAFHGYDHLHLHSRDIEVVARLLAEREAALLALVQHAQMSSMARAADLDAARARIADLEKSDALLGRHAELVEQMEAREAEHLQRIADLEAWGTHVVWRDERDAAQAREAAHLAHIKALLAKRLVDMREAARWGAEVSANVEDATDHQIASDIMEEFATFDAEDELLQRLAHYDVEGEGDK